MLWQQLSMIKMHTFFSVHMRTPFDLAVPLLRFICQIALAQGIKKSVNICKVKKSRGKKSVHAMLSSCKRWLYFCA